VVIGDWNSSTITCVNTTSPNASNCGNNLGNTYGTPLIRRLHNGDWGVIFGNGYGSSSGDAGIYVMTIDQSTAATKFYYLSTSTGSSTSPNGIAYVTAADLDGDHITDYVYAGDLQGNVWRFDLTSCAASLPASGSCTATTGWAVTSKPVFKTQTGQPITTPVILASSQLVGKAPVLLVSFGTGQRTQFTATSATTYASATQSLYGVWDWNMSAWNAASGSQYASLSTSQVSVAEGNSQSSAPATLTYSNLLYQPYVISSGNVNASNNATVTWVTCTSGTTITCNGGQFGWYVNLPGTNGTGSSEQIVSSPVIYQEGFFVNSTIPAAANVLSCAISSDTGNTYIVNVLSGGTFTTTTGTPSKVSGFVNNSTVNTVGQNLNLTGSLAIVNNGSGTGGGTYAVGQNLNPTPGSPPGQVLKFSLPTNVQASRVTWTQLR
jgi:type IV pilus assembly protein PilY1